MTEQSTDALLDITTTLRFARHKTTHGYRLAIEDNAVRIYTRCGLPTTGEEYTVTHSVISCDGCHATQPLIPVAP